MIIKQTDNITFGYHNILKTQYLKGNLKTVKYGFYGDKLNKKNVSLEHLQPKSKGGKSELFNFVLASKSRNQARGNKDIQPFVDKENAMRYLLQFVGIKAENFNSDNYIKDILNTLKNLGVDLCL
jgi:hypothetical protein